MLWLAIAGAVVVLGLVCLLVLGRGEQPVETFDLETLGKAQVALHEIRCRLIVDEIKAEQDKTARVIRTEMTRELRGKGGGQEK